MFYQYQNSIGPLLAATLLAGCAAAPQSDCAVQIEPLPVVTDTAPPDAQDTQVVQVAYQENGEDESVIDPLQAPGEFLPAPMPLADDPPLGLAELEQLALDNNPSLGESWAQVQAARGKWLQAGLKPNPRLGYSGQQIGSNGEAEQRGLYVEQDIIRGKKLQLEQAVVSREIAHAEQQFEIQRRRVMTDVRTGYYAVLCAQRRLELTQELVRIGNAATKAAESLYEKKERSRRDLLQARIESRTAQAFLQQARNQHVASWRMLAAVMGTPQMAPTPLSGELDAEAAELHWDQALQQLLAESPEIAAAYANVQRAQWAVDRARAEAISDVNVQGIVQHDNSTDGVNGALLVSLPLPVWNRNQGGIRQAQSELVAARRAVQRTELSLQNRLAPVFERYLSSRYQVSNFRDGILQDAKVSLELTKEGYDVGELTFIDLLMAQRTYFRASLNYVDALCEMWGATAEIEGLLLKGSLDGGTGSEPGAAASAGNPGLPGLGGQL